MEQLLSSFFQQYTHHFFQYDVSAVKSFYQTPCTLSTPDKLVVLTEKNIDKELNSIFEQLTQVKLNAIKALNSSYEQITNDLILVNIDWQLFTGNEQLFTEFCAVYHLVKIDNTFKIINISSQEFNQGLRLENNISLK